VLAYPVKRAMLLLSQALFINIEFIVVGQEGEHAKTGAYLS